MTTLPLGLRHAVADRAHYCCEYCGIPEDALLVPHEPDHIISEQHGGATVLENLAYACFRCNRYKGPNIATRDPQAGGLIPLFSPRIDRWDVHFQLDGAKIVPLTPVGRGTALLLRFNDEQRLLLRAELLRQRRFSPPMSS